MKRNNVQCWQLIAEILYINHMLLGGKKEVSGKYCIYKIITLVRNSSEINYVSAYSRWAGNQWVLKHPQQHVKRLRLMSHLKVHAQSYSSNIITCEAGSDKSSHINIIIRSDKCDLFGNWKTELNKILVCKTTICNVENSTRIYKVILLNQWEKSTNNTIRVTDQSVLLLQH